MTDSLRQTDRPNDMPRYSVCSSRSYLRSTAMRPNNNNNNIIIIIIINNNNNNSKTQ